MSAILIDLANWAAMTNVNLDSVDISCKYKTITFWHSRETRRTFRHIKKVVDNFEATGSPPYVSLEKKVIIAQEEWDIYWKGAYECKALGYNCSMADFADNESPEDEDEKVISDKV